MTVRRTLIALACLTLATALPAQANTVQDASRSLRQGQTAQALEQIDRFLADKPKDAQGRFLKGTILTEMGRNAEAIAIFTKLTEDYPELPEPYNNLAVIYAQQKQYDKAKQALEQAIRTHPSYATAHENLGDLYARLASQAYGKALQLDSSNASAQNKLALIKDLTATSTRPGTKPAEPAKPTPPVVTPPVAPTAPVAPPTPTIVATAPTPAKPIAEPAKPTEAAKPETAKPEAPKPEVKTEAKPEAKVEPKSADSNSEVSKVIDAWAAAWTKKDVKGYLAKYAKDFKVPGGASRASWETERSQRINKPGKISVDVDNIKITVDAPDQVTARFRQNYKSATLSSSTTKTLVLVKHEGKWLIQQERVGG